MEAIRKEIIRLRNRLLDLGDDNPLLNFKRRDERTITISDRDPGAIYDLLITRESGLRVVSSKGEGPIEAWDLRAPYSQSDIDRRMRNLQSYSSAIMEEEGHTVLFITLGFLSWEDRDGRSFRSPLILVPCSIRTDATGSDRLHWSGEDVILSPTLVERMREEGVSLPDLADPQNGDSIRRYHSDLRDHLREVKGYELINSQVIDCFTFKGSVLYRDLDLVNWSPDYIDSHSLLKAILRPGTVTDHKEPLEEKGQSFRILDADESQLDVIEAVIRGQSVVVEGPPGTGKSQTIANIICECMGRGRKVLFVSEKMAALEVVKARLDQAGLFPYILELHSEKTNRRALIKEMDSRLSMSIPKVEADDPDPRHALLRDELDAYVRAVSEPMGRRGLSPYELIGERQELIESQQGILFPLAVKEPDFIDEGRWAETMTDLATLQELVLPLLPLSRNPWRDCGLTELPAKGEESVSDMMSKVLSYLESSLDGSRSLAKSMGMEPPLSIGDMYAFTSEVNDLLRCGSISIANLLDEKASETADIMEAILEGLQTLQGIRKVLLESYDRSILDIDPRSILQSFERHSQSPWRHLVPSFRQSRNAMLKFVKDGPPGDDETMLEHLRMLSEYRSLQVRTSNRGSEARRFFGNQWTGDDSNVKTLSDSLRWARNIQSNLRGGRYTDATLIAISGCADNVSLREKVSSLEASLDSLNSSIQGLCVMLRTDMDSLFRPGKEGLRPHHVRNRIREMESGLPSLARWTRFRRMAERIAGGPAEAAVKSLQDGQIDPDHLCDSLRLGYLDEMLRIAMDTRPVLRSFSTEEHEQRRKEFLVLDASELEGNRLRLLRELRKTSLEAETHLSPMRALKGEINRSRGNLPVRRLMSEAGEAILALKPCFMMSPLSVAQFLDHRTVSFDVVIFDEASQLLPEESMGALLRARQAVVMGDSHQLPPSTFFESKGAESEGVATLADMESLLGICRTALPSRSLRWHYRSRHPSLMEVPNTLFYGHRLLIPPSPMREKGDMGLQLRHLPNTVYERGGSGTNPKEAQKVARDVRAHFEEHPGMSLAVATFSSRQKDAVEAEVAKQVKRHPELHALLNKGEEPFIIKNLENLQGDERDRVLVSLGYGLTADGRMSMSFGPLNKDGGERRLNVLMTRARHSCIIYSNFRASDMKVRPESPAGVRHLQSFLQFAESKVMFLEDLEPSHDPLAVSVASFLRRQGYELDMNLGNPGSRLDIVIKSPDGKRYLCAVLLDGRWYQGMSRASDRDRLWGSLLSAMGWSWCRVWSTEWHLDREAAERRLLAQVRSIVGEPPSKDERLDGTMEGPEDRSGTKGITADDIDNILKQMGTLHMEVVYRVVRDRLGLRMVSRSLKEGVDSVIESLIQEGNVTREGDFLVPKGDVGIIKDVDRRDWDPAWVHPSVYGLALNELGTASASDSPTVKAVADRLNLKNGKKLKDHLSSM